MLTWHCSFCHCLGVMYDPLTLAYGPTHCVLQNLSLFSCACALAAGPIILGLDAAATTTTAKVSVVATLATFGVFTTGLVRAGGAGKRVGP